MNPLLLRRRWMVQDAGVDYSKQYLTIVSLADNNTISFVASDSASGSSREISYSVDGGSTWSGATSTTAGTTLATLNIGGKIYIRSRGTTYFYSNGTYYNRFTSTGNCALEGNIMSLLYMTFIGTTTLPGSGYTLCGVFRDWTGLVDITNLVMPATTLTAHCYERLFYGTGITSLPANLLPATTLADYCYYYMFMRTAITEIPSGFLPATTIAPYCYAEMFDNCDGLTTLPSGLLPATTLAERCYYAMFYGCDGLVTVATDLMGATTLAKSCCRAMFNNCASLQRGPDLNAKTLVTECYYTMFNSSPNVNYVKCTATSISASNATYRWLVGASSTGTFVRASGVSWPRSTSGAPSGWTLQNA